MSEWAHECLVCGHVIDWDDDAGWVHEARTRRFDHDALAEYEPPDFDGSGDED